MAELVVALDFPAADVAVDMAGRLRGTAPWMKVGLELFCAAGPDVVRAVADLGFRVFLDLKFHDIPNTVRGAVRSAVRSGADMVNIHLMGGERMARAAVEGLHEGAQTTGSVPLLFGVTVLTSTAQGELPGISTDIGEYAASLAASGAAWGLNGVVCSGYEVESIKKRCGASFLCLTPGIRPGGGAGGDDQRRVMTPAQAVSAGSDYLVVGRPVTGAADPAAVARAIMAEMAAVRR